MAKEKAKTGNVVDLMKVKEHFYRGQKLEFLKTLDVREVAKYLPSRSRRSVLRNFNVHENFVKKCEATVANGKKIRTHLRDIVIVPKLVGMQIGIHSGKEFQDVNVNAKMIGHRLGEFALTRKRVNHGTAGIGATKGSKADKK